ncbi:MAG: CbiQ family ECF transporter T component [Desulfovibrionaceae bacterium]
MFEFAGRTDPRLKLLLALLLGVLIWRAGWLGVAVYAMGLGTFVVQGRDRLSGGMRIVRTYIVFVLFWTAAKCLVDIWGAYSVEDALFNGLLLGERVACLLLLGMALGVSTSAPALGRGLTALLRPILGRRHSWKIALAFSLMVHYLPMMWRSLDQIRAIVKRRCPNLSVCKRVLLLAQALLRSMGQKTWDQSLAVAARNMDHARAWQCSFAFRWREWTGGAVLAVGLVALTML